ncbi:MAG: AAA family ATPase, partial [Cohaesibacteraceae bacterium]|nr:AAA family ATPase [Cohaesibacteraceae bacterium]
MLATLAVRDIVLIDQLDIDFSSGMTVLTGETGAGKSILLDSLSLALGGRGDGGLVREGAKQGQVVAIFDLPPSHPAFSFLLENDIEANDELILRRVQSADGRTRAFVNDQPISARLLRALGVMLVEIHGQHDERALVDPVLHRQLLDAFGGHAGLLSRVSSSHTRWRKAGRELSALQKTIAEARQEADYLKASVEELAL